MSLCLQLSTLIPKECEFRALGKGKESWKGVVSLTPRLADTVSPEGKVRGWVTTRQYLRTESSAPDLCMI